MRPYAIEKRFALRTPIYTETAAYGHMGRTPQTVTKTFKDGGGNIKKIKVKLFPWEELDYVKAIKKALKKYEKPQRGRGRPEKAYTYEELLAMVEKPKRGPGRPKKRGRPRKYKATTGTGKVGRPRKATAAAPKAKTGKRGRPAKKAVVA
ncbi:unnamed protein product [Rotaria sordida]|uniref:Uncharacterized protein n=1 Tax=Rotaria sordida TaxID=392033 RepID=A0A813N366_9BILA|nr:unnamed protein product [Rotaria sordida]